RSDEGLELEVDGKEAGLLDEPDQIALVEIEHRVVRRLNLRVNLLDARGQVGDAVTGIAPEALLPLLHPEPVDRLEAREPAAGLEHAEELGERLSFLRDVDQDRARGDDVDARVGHAGELGSARLDEAAALREAERLRRLPAEVEQVVRDVREDDVPRAAVERAESDHPLAAADVEQRLALSEAGPVEHLLAA